MKNNLLAKLRKAGSLLLAGALAVTTFGAAVPALADDPSVTATLQVTGIENESWDAATDGSYEAGSTKVYAYPVVQLTEDANGNDAWQYGSSTANSVKSYVEKAANGHITDGAAIAYLYTNLNKGEGGMAHDGNGLAVVGGNGTSATPENTNVVELTYDDASEAWSATGVLPGLYLIAANNEVSSASYSATIVPVNFVYDETTGQASVGNVAYDADGKETIDGAVQGVVKAAVKKSDEPTLDKEVIDTDGSESKHGDANIGDTVNFEITVHIPDYTEAWNTENLRYVINDALSTGLTLDQDSVKVEDTAVSEYFTDTNSVISLTANSISLDLRQSDVYSHKGSDLVISYSAQVNDQAGVNFDEETNTVTLQYSTTSNTTDLSTPKSDETHHYTFGFDTTVNGTGSDTTTEITKYGVTGTSASSTTVPLEGAQFQLFRGSSATGAALKFTSAGQYAEDQEDTSALDYITSGSQGALSVSGLDAGTYTLKEYKAPAGYSLDTTSYRITITPTYAQDGTLTTYDVKVEGASAENTITFTHTKLSNGTVSSTDTSAEADTFAINNIPLSSLPSTGAHGIIVLTIAAIAMMAAFGSAFVVLKKGGKKQA